MNCAGCGAETTKNWGNGNTVVCEKCSSAGESPSIPENKAESGETNTAKISNENSSYPVISILFFFLAGITLFGSLLFFGEFWPGDPGAGREWKATAYMPSLTFLAAGVIQFAIYTAIGQGLAYLKWIVSNTASTKT